MSRGREHVERCSGALLIIPIAASVLLDAGLRALRALARAGGGRR